MLCSTLKVSLPAVLKGRKVSVEFPASVSSSEFLSKCPWARVVSVRKSTGAERVRWMAMGWPTGGGGLEV